MNKHKRLISDLWRKGVDSVSGKNSVQRAIDENSLAMPTNIIAVGKAASDMALGAVQALGINNDVPILVITKYDHTSAELRNLPNITVIESAHPIPDINSLHAGDAALNAVKNMRDDSRLLLLVSGGASSLVEVPSSGVTLADLISLNKKMISKDYAIEEINAARRKYSQIKSGGLLTYFKGAHVDIILVSDVKGDDPNVIGSGIGTYDARNSEFSANTYIAANNMIARNTVAKYAEELGLGVIVNEESLYDEVEHVTEQLKSQLLSGGDGIYIWGGEPTVNLPENPGLGGRNQALALMLAREIKGLTDISIVVGGTDGTDGPTEAAGGLVDGRTYNEDLRHDEAIMQANAGNALKAIDSLLITGPTGTNVMDLVVALKVQSISTNWE